MIRNAALPIALFLLGLVWLGGASKLSFTSHMIRHMLIVAVIAPLLVCALPAVRQIQVHPLLAAFVEFAVVWGWHLPSLHLTAQISSGWYVAEQASFLFAGLLVWTSALRNGAELSGAGALLLTSMHMTLLGALLILAARPLYDAICYGGDPLSDQQMGGMLMLAIGTPVYLAAGLWRIAKAIGDEGQSA